MRVTAQTKAATEQAIRNTARKLFVRKGLEATSTREIARGARVAIGTLFNYFASKESLAFAIAAEAFAQGRGAARARLANAQGRTVSLEEELFTLAACDIRALEPIRGLVADVLEAALSPLSAGESSSDASALRTQRLEDAAAAMERHGFGQAATAAVMHLYWSLYLGVLSFWSADPSPRQEDTWAMLDTSVRMFTGALRPDSALNDTGDSPITRSYVLDASRDVESHSLGAAKEVNS